MIRYSTVDDMATALLEQFDWFASRVLEWTDRSVNPIRARLNGQVGHHCVKLGTGCANCYSSRLQSRFKMPEFRADQRRGVEVFFDDARLREVLTRRKPTKWFWCDMTDLFGDWVEEAWIDKVFAVCALTPQHTHQILTKRPERMRDYLAAGQFRDARIADQARSVSKSVVPFALPDERVFDGRRVARGEPWAINAWPLQNVWLGVSVEDQATADQRIPILLQTPAAVRWVSYEPALAGVDFTDIVVGRGSGSEHHINVLSMEGDNIEDDEEYSGACLDWVVVGGESGPKARPCDVAWIRSVVEQCEAAGVPAFVKQLGTVPTVLCGQCGRTIGKVMSGWTDACGPTHTALIVESLSIHDRKGGDQDEWPEDLRVRQFPAVQCHRLREAGRV